MEDRSVSKRRKPTGDEVNDSDEDLKKTKVQEIAGPSGRGRGRGCGRGRGRSAKTAERELLHREMEIEPTLLLAPPLTQVGINIPALPQQLPPQDSENKDMDDGSNHPKQEQPQSPKEGNDGNSWLDRDFDLNTQSLDLEIKPPVVTATGETKPEEYPGWSISDISNINPMQIVSMGKRLDEDEEDYDEEDD